MRDDEARPAFNAEVGDTSTPLSTQGDGFFKVFRCMEKDALAQVSESHFPSC